MSGRFSRAIGTGGIGTGILFALQGEKTIERTESRGAILSGARDYCKQHIILNYLAKTLAGDAQVYAVGKIGADENGARLRREMEEAGILTKFVEQDAQKPTMCSVCLEYPDKSVCNITASNSACGNVDEAYMKGCLEKMKATMDERTLVIAAPEVPVCARLELLKGGREKGAYCVGSFVSGEAEEFARGGGLFLSDLLVINEDEAMALVGKSEHEKMAFNMKELLESMGIALHVIITCGSQGSYCVSKEAIERIPGKTVKAASTAGAGDAYTAGVICGIHFGLPLQKKGKALVSAPELGAAFAEQSVTCIHTIDPSIGREFAQEFLQRFRFIERMQNVK